MAPTSGSFGNFWIRYHSPIGQEFMPTIGNLTKVDVYIEESHLTGASGGGQLTINIKRDGITGLIVTSHTQQVQPGFKGWLSFDVPDVSLIPGSLYVIQLVEYEGSNLLWYESEGDLYPRGRAIFQGQPMANRDWWFRTWDLP
ncbi:MAG: hypothetical protein V3U79_05430 [Dehalococcoidia bacterium]